MPDDAGTLPVDWLGSFGGSRRVTIDPIVLDAAHHVGVVASGCKSSSLSSEKLAIRFP